MVFIFEVVDGILIGIDCSICWGEMLRVIMRVDS